MLVGRSRIVARVARSESRLVSIVAPAGFGKTTTAHAIADAQGPSMACEMPEVADLKAFARCTIQAIKQAAGERSVQLANDLFRHLQAGVTDAQIAGFVLDAWSFVDDRTVCIFDNLEAIADQPNCLDLLVRLIKVTGRRMLILCARPPFVLLNSRLVPPNEHLRLRITDLAFTREETRLILEEKVTEGNVDAVFACTQGWPVAVLLFGQLSRNGQLERALGESSGTALDDLRDYLLGEVLESTRGPLFDTLVALVATRSMGIDAAFRATRGAATPEMVNEVCQRLPLVMPARDGKYDIHPLIVSIVEATASVAIERYRLTAAESYRSQCRLGEAARMYLDAGNTNTAADCLEGVVGPYLDRNALAGFHDLIERLPAEVLPNYPRLWAALALLRRDVVSLDVLLAEGLALRAALRPNLQSLECKQVSAHLVELATLKGEHDLVERLLADYTLDEYELSPGNVALLLSDTIRNLLRGRTHGAADRTRHLLPLVHNDVVRAYVILRVDAIIATMCGRFDDSLAGLARAVELARSSGWGTRMPGMLQHQAVVAWLSGDDVGVKNRIDEMRRIGATLGSIDYAAIARAWDIGLTEGLADMLPRMRAWLLLMLAGKTSDNAERRALLTQAFDASREAQDIWAELLIITAEAMSEPAERANRLQHAVTIAPDVGQQAVVDSILSLCNDGDGAPTLRSLAQRFDPTLGHRGVVPVPIRVIVLSRTVYRGDHRLHVSKRVLSLIITLAILEHVPRQTLLDLLWGDDNLGVETNALKMLLSRARRQLGDPDVIRVENGVYSLRDDVVTDFHQLQRLLDSLAANDPLTTAQRDALRAAYQQFKSTWLSKESVPSIDAAISALRHRVVERLAQDALDRCEIALAIGFADDLRRRDANDETAYELLIRAYVRSGNNAGALREYRVYSDHLMKELGVEPSFSVAELLQGAHSETGKN